MKTNSTRVSVYLTEHQLRRLRRGSARTGLRQAELIRRTLDAHLDNLVCNLVNHDPEETDYAEPKAHDSR